MLKRPPRRASGLRWIQAQVLQAALGIQATETNDVLRTEKGGREAHPPLGAFVSSTKARPQIPWRKRLSGLTAQCTIAQVDQDSIPERSSHLLIHSHPPNLHQQAFVWMPLLFLTLQLRNQNFEETEPLACGHKAGRQKPRKENNHAGLWPFP